jgi:hypothetical protein
MSDIKLKPVDLRQRRPAARSRHTSLTMDIPPKVLTAVTKLCYAKGQTRAEVVRAALVEHLQARGYL